MANLDTTGLQNQTPSWGNEGNNQTWGSNPGGGTGTGTGTGTGSGGNNNVWGSFGGGGGSSSPGNLGQGMYPWLQPYGGNFTAPMSPYENNALQGYNSFVQGGQGLNGAGNYLQNELGGQYLNMNSNPYLQQIQQGEQGMKNYNDQQALNRINSSMALGGTSMSGAKLGAQNDYLNQSNNQFQALMGQLMNQNYGMERGLQSQAPGQLANLANTAGQGYSQLFGMGALPRSLQQNDYNAQYNDFLRQNQGLQGAFQSPDQQMLQMLYGGGYKGQYQPQYGSSQLDQILGSLGGSNIDWSSILGGLGNGIGSLFGGGSTDNTQPQQDGVHMGYDSPAPGTSGPANYYDQNWYQNALNQRTAQRAQQQNQGAPNTLPAALVTLLLSMLGGNKSQSNKAKSGVGLGGPGQSSPSSKQGSTPWDTTGGQSIASGVPGTIPVSPGDPNAGGMTDPNNPFAQSPYSDPFSAGYNNPLFDPNNFAGSPTDPYGDYSNQTGLFDPNNYAGGGGGGGGDMGGGGGDPNAGFDGWRM